MKMKYTLINRTTNEQKVFYIVKHGKNITYEVNGKEQNFLPLGSKVKWNGQEKVVDSRVAIADIDGEAVSVILLKSGAPKITAQDDSRISANMFANNFIWSLPVFIIFMAIMVALIVATIIIATSK